jgi:hypothetical protein
MVIRTNGLCFMRRGPQSIKLLTRYFRDFYDSIKCFYYAILNFSYPMHISSKHSIYKYLKKKKLHERITKPNLSKMLHSI